MQIWNLSKQMSFKEINTKTKKVLEGKSIREGFRETKAKEELSKRKRKN